MSNRCKEKNLIIVIKNSQKHYMSLYLRFFKTLKCFFCDFRMISGQSDSICMDNEKDLLQERLNKIEFQGTSPLFNFLDNHDNFGPLVNLNRQLLQTDVNRIRFFIQSLLTIKSVVNKGQDMNK